MTPRSITDIVLRDMPLLHASDTVEVAFVVQDDWQGRGLGAILFGALVAAAGARGIERFRAWVLADNRRMLELITRLGDVQQRSFAQGVVELVFTPRAAASPGAVA